MRIEYQDDYNILELHKNVLSYFKNQINSIPELEAQIKKQEEKYSQFKLVVDKKNCQAEINRLKEEVESIKSKTKYNAYMEQATLILKQYKVLKEQIGKKIYGEEQIISPEQRKKREELVDSYMSIVEDYIPIEICHTPIHMPVVCHDCGSDNLEIGDGVRICNSCNSIRDVYTKDSFYNSGKKVNMVTKGNYEDRDNFNKAILRFQGKQPNKLPDDLFQKLDIYFSNYGLPKCNQVKDLPLAERKGGRLTKETMHSALSRIGYSGFYEDINLICHLAWGWELPDISHLEEKLMEDYDISQKVYNEIKEGHSSPNVQYRLYRHLQHLGYPCRVSDFKMIQTEEILSEYEERWKEICRRLNWEYVRINL